MLWFEQLMGFKEENPAQVRANIESSANSLRSRINQKTYVYGRLEIPQLKELRARTSELNSPKGKLQLKEVVANVQDLHTDSANAGAFFQAASQFNLLEMAAPSVLPEEGVGIYAYDRTQGPACAIAAGAGTIFRNYFADLGKQIGQTSTQQIDCLLDIGQVLGNQENRLWTMQNGYALANKAGLQYINQQLVAMNEPQRDELRQLLRIGLQLDTQITLHHCSHQVTQAYCSALPVRYSNCPPYLWGNFARLVLEASYEATLHAATLNFEKTGNPKVFLTLLGGGVFGNDMKWIEEALTRALTMFANVPLEVAIVSYGASQVQVQDLIARFLLANHQA